MNNVMKEMKLSFTILKGTQELTVFLSLLRIIVTEIIPRPDQYPTNWDDWKVSIDINVFKLLI